MAGGYSWDNSATMGPTTMMPTFGALVHDSTGSPTGAGSLGSLNPLVLLAVGVGVVVALILPKRKG